MACVNCKLPTIPKLVVDFVFVVLYIFDLTTDIYLAYTYKVNGHPVYFGLTLTFIVYSCLMTNGAVIERKLEPLLTSKLSICLKWIFRICFLGYFWMLIEIFCYECKNKRQPTKSNCIKLHQITNTDDYSEETASRQVNQLSNEHLREDREAISDHEPTVDKSRLQEYKHFIQYMRWYEHSMETFPQLCLQLYIIAKSTQLVRSEFDNGFPGMVHNTFNVSASELHWQQWTNQDTTEAVAQALSISTSFISIAWSSATYSQSHSFYKVYEVGRKISQTQFIFHLMWTVFRTISNMFTIILFISIFSFLFIVIPVTRLVIAIAFGKYFFREKLRKILFSDYHNYSGTNINIFIKSLINKYGNQFYYYYIFRNVYTLIEDNVVVAAWCWMVDPEHSPFYWWCVGFHTGRTIILPAVVAICLINAYKDLKRTKSSNSSPSPATV